jgi:hypothetical protein
VQLRIGRARNFRHLDTSPGSVRTVCEELQRCVIELGEDSQ